MVELQFPHLAENRPSTSRAKVYLHISLYICSSESVPDAEGMHEPSVTRPCVCSFLRTYELNFVPSYRSVLLGKSNPYLTRVIQPIAIVIGSSVEGHHFWMTAERQEHEQNYIMCDRLKHR